MHSYSDVKKLEGIVLNSVYASTYNGLFNGSNVGDIYSQISIFDQKHERSKLCFVFRAEGALLQMASDTLDPRPIARSGIVGWGAQAGVAENHVLLAITFSELFEAR